MAQIIGGGPPVNDAERVAITHLRDHGPDEWLVLHNIEISVHGDPYEVDIVVVTGHSVVLIDVKGTRGRIEVAGQRWYPSRRSPFGSPVRKLRGVARAFKGLLQREQPRLNRVFVDSLVVLTAGDADLVDPNDREDADANDVVRLDQMVQALGDVSRVRTGMVRDTRPHADDIVTALTGTVRYPTGPLRLGNWEVRERLGGTDEVTEYRAVNSTAPGSGSVLLRVYRADQFALKDVRTAERIAIANAYEVLARLPSCEYIVGQRDFFPVEDEGRFVLVLDDVHGQALQLYLANPRRPLGFDAKLKIIGDILRGLAHAHRFRVIHRALSPSTVLVTEGGRALLTGFDYARPEDPRGHTVLNRLTEALDPSYVAPECQARPQTMSRAADIYAAGVVAFQLLTDELPFANPTDQHDRNSELPGHVLASAGLSDDLTGLLRRMCASDPASRPSAAECLDLLRRAVGGDGRGGGGRGRGSSPEDGERPNYWNLPEGFELTQRFRVLRKLGSGAFGVVYQVYDNIAFADQALKIVLRDRDSEVERIRHEYRILIRLDRHPNVVKAESADYLPDGTTYLVAEYLDGQDVSDLIKDRSLGPADALKLGIDIATGLKFLHDNGVLHCDIKPRNLIRTDQGCKIIDFNVAVTADSSLSKAGGTPRYAPPDFPADGPPTAADLADRDVYGAGVVLYQAVTGAWPFESRNPAPGERPIDPSSCSDLPALSEEFTAVLLKAIAPLRSDRYATAAELLAALEGIDGVHRRPPEIETGPEPAVLPAAGGANPFVAHLKTLYSQSTSSNAGTRGKDPHLYQLYVPTALDTELIPAVLDGAYTLVVVTGNAGDGKTAFLEQLVAHALDRGAVAADPRSNGADIRLLSGRWLRTNHDGSQDEGERGNDDVLLDFFAPFAGDTPVSNAGETRLIAINEGRLVDFLTTHEDRFGHLTATVRAGLQGQDTGTGIAVINLNRRSVVADTEQPGGVSESIFDRVLRQMTHERFWEACDSCELAKVCYAPHNAHTFRHPSAGPQVIRRLKDLYTLAHLRGHTHVTLRDLRSALAFMLTSGRDCAEIQELYREGDASTILAGFYFNSWAGTPGTRDRLLAFLQDVDVTLVPDPALDRRIDYMGPEAGQAVMTVDQRGSYDIELLRTLFVDLPRAVALDTGNAHAHRNYLASARRRFYFECVDDRNAERLLPYRSARRFFELLHSPGRVTEHLPEILDAINRGEGLLAPARLGNVLALQVRQVQGGTIRSYRLYDAANLSLAIDASVPSPYLEQQPGGVVLTYQDASGHHAALDIKLDLYELLHRLRSGYLPGIAEQQGLYTGLSIFKNTLSAAPYQELLLTVGEDDQHQRISREQDGRLVMRAVTGEDS